MTTFRLRGYRDELWSIELDFAVPAESLEEAQAKAFGDPETYLVAQGPAEAVEVIREFPQEPSDYSEVPA